MALLKQNLGKGAIKKVDFPFKELETKDGSPSLSLPPTWEPMHSLEGAFSETQYIYLPTIKQAFLEAPQPRILSLGLGLGYNEILVAAESFSHQKKLQLLSSFESVDFLRKYFQDWLFDNENPLTATYDQILSLTATTFKINPEDIKKRLKNWFEEKQFVIHEAISIDTSLTSYNGILFDAFSSKTSEELWTESFLTYFFKNVTTKPSFVSTYACTGALKRVLRSLGYTLDIQPGFAKKRQSTFAYQK